MQLCISNFKYALLINGFRTDQISSTKRLYEDCSLSPYLLILYFDIHSKFLKFAV